MIKFRTLIGLKLLFIFFLFDLDITHAFSLKQSSKCSNNNGSQMSAGKAHAPIYNPGGTSQGSQSLYSSEFSSMCSKNMPNYQNNSPPGKMIATETINSLSSKDSNDISKEYYYCVENEEIPDNLKPFVYDKCEQEYCVDQDINDRTITEVIASKEYENNNEYTEQDLTVKFKHRQK